VEGDAGRSVMKQWKSKPCGRKGSIWSSSSSGVRKEIGFTLRESSRDLSWSVRRGNVIIVESAVTGGGGSVSNVTGGGDFVGDRQLAKVSATTSMGGAGVSGGAKDYWRVKIRGLSGETTTKGAIGGSSHSERSSESIPTSQQSNQTGHLVQSLSYQVHPNTYV
jgi:hypothetical protein